MCVSRTNTLAYFVSPSVTKKNSILTLTFMLQNFLRTQFTNVHNKLEYLPLADLSSLVLCFSVRLEPVQVVHLSSVPLEDMLLALPANIDMAEKTC